MLLSDSNHRLHVVFIANSPFRRLASWLTFSFFFNLQTARNEVCTWICRCESSNSSSACPIFIIDSNTDVPVNASSLATVMILTPTNFYSLTCWQNTFVLCFSKWTRTKLSWKLIITLLGKVKRLAKKLLFTSMLELLSMLHTNEERENCLKPHGTLRSVNGRELFKAPIWNKEKRCNKTFSDTIRQVTSTVKS